MQAIKMKKSALPRPSIVDAILDDIPDLMRDGASHVVVSAGGRDRGPTVARGPGGGKRLVYDAVERVDVQYEQEKQPQTITRKVDPLRDLHKRGALGKNEDSLLIAGLRFQDDFDRAHFGSSSGMRFDMMPASGKVNTDGGRTDNVVDARNATLDAMIAVGGPDSIGGMAVWQIVGHRKTLREMSRNNGTPDVLWKGALLAALGSLERHYERNGR